LALVITSCQKDTSEDLFGKTPSERIETAAAELRKELVAPANGWRLTYFSNNTKFGGFSFLMKFNENGRVEMNSDAGTNTVTTSNYEIKVGEGALLSFTSKNHIHLLADAYSPSDLRGKGFEGEYEFIYYGKEGNKLKFKTQRKNNEQFIYFEPATPADWEKVSTFYLNRAKIGKNPFHYFLRASSPTKSEDYTITITNYGLMTVASMDNKDVQKVGAAVTNDAFIFNPAFKFQGKEFTRLEKDGNTTPAKYQATIDGVTVKIEYLVTPPDAFFGDDYKDVESRKTIGLVMIPELLLDSPYLSSTFYNNILKLTDDYSEQFYLLRADFLESGEVDIQVGYSFGPDQLSWAYIEAQYEIRDKKIFIKNPGNIIYTKPENWNNPNYSYVKAQAIRALNTFVNIGADGFRVKKTSETIEIFDIYVIQSVNSPEYITPVLGFNS